MKMLIEMLKFQKCGVSEDLDMNLNITKETSKEIKGDQKKVINRTINKLMHTK